jgi:hypothetical protein
MFRGTGNYVTKRLLRQIHGRAGRLTLDIIAKSFDLAISGTHARRLSRVFQYHYHGTP